MLKEVSFGIIVFKKEKGKIYYLLLQHKKDYFNFPKGHQEEGETPLKTALRETLEETGLKDIRIIKGFKAKNNYFFKKNKLGVFKTVIFFLGEAKEKEVKISSEHIDYGWFSYKDSLSILKIKDLRLILQKANDFLEYLEKK